MALRSVIPWAYLVLALAFSLLVAVITPPFMVADEVTHFSRADMITHGFAAEHVADPAGGPPRLLLQTHTSIYDAFASFDHVLFNPAEKAKPSDLAAAAVWRFDARVGRATPGAALNPVLYAPSVVAVGLGRHFGWTILSTLMTARVLTALVCAGLGFVALRRAVGVQLPMFAILMLPMCQALFGAASQDGPLICLTALAVGELSRGMGEDRPLRPAEWLLATLCLTLCAVAKAPYVCLLLLVAAAPCARRGWALGAAVAGALAAVGWAAWTAADGWIAAPPPGVLLDASGQASWLLDHPLATGPIAVATLQARGVVWLREFIGVLGWLDTLLPPAYYWAAWGMLFVAFAAAAGGRTGRDWAAVRWLVPAVALATFAAVVGALYLAWTPVGGPVVQGVQGRYLLPVGLVLTLLIGGQTPDLAGGGGLRARLGWAVLAFPAVSIVVTVSTLVDRYYGP